MPNFVPLFRVLLVLSAIGVIETLIGGIWLVVWLVHHVSIGMHP